MRSVTQNMITLLKTGKYSALLQLDEHGGQKLLSSLLLLFNNRKGYIHIAANIDMALVTGRESQLRSCLIQLSQGSGTIARHPDGIIWNLDEGEVEYATKRVSGALEAECFDPAEFLQAEITDQKIHIDIFAEFIRNAANTQMRL